MKNDDEQFTIHFLAWSQASCSALKPAPFALHHPAIVVSNIFRSESGVAQLRLDHQAYHELTGPTATSAGFKAAHSQYLSYMNIEQPRLCDNLRKVRAPFNPLL